MSRDGTAAAARKWSLRQEAVSSRKAQAEPTLK